MRKAKEKIFGQFVIMTLLMLVLLQACSEATITPIIATATPTTTPAATATLPVTPTVLVPTQSPKPVPTTTSEALMDILGTAYRADTSQIEGQDWKASDYLKVNWTADKHILFAGTNTTPSNILTLKIFGPFSSNQKAKKITINEPNPIIATEFDPKTHNKQPFTTDLKLPDNLDPGFYTLLCVSEMYSYRAISIIVFRVVK